MKHKKISKTTLVLISVSFVFVIASMVHCSLLVQRQIQSELENSLFDVATQNAVTVNQEIKDNFNLLFSIAKELRDNSIEEEQLMCQLQSFVDTYHFKRMGLVDTNGQVTTTDGYVQDLSYRLFFQDGLKGMAGVTNTLIDSIGDSPEPINVFSVPVYQEDGTIQGVLFATYRTQQFADIISVDSFDGNGFSCIVDTTGEVVANSSLVPEAMQESSNFYTYLTEQDPENQSVQGRMEYLFAEKDSGIGSYRRGDQNYYYCAIPLNSSETQHQWYALTMVPDNVLKDRAYPIMHNMRMLIAFIFAVVILCIGVYLYTYRKQRQELLHLAYVDSLTGGDNFASFKEHLKSYDKASGYYLALDISSFKIINSSCGVAKGDETLIAIWKVLKQFCRPEEYCAHIHADRFIALLQDNGRQKLEERLKELVHDLGALSLELNVPKIFPLIGIYQTSDHSEVEQNYGKAVQAKYLVKGLRNRNYAFYDELDVAQLTENRQLEDDFEDALQNGEFQIWYQPKARAEDGTILGAEALVRWQKPDGTMLSPAKFIPLFERNGNITTLDEYVFQCVCAQQKRWLEQGAEMYPISVNISRVSLYFSNIVEKYRSILDSYELDPKYIQLEITESATINNSDIASLIDQFHHAGFTMLLDDFGSGYSSLSSLNVMHFDTIKLDKSLIDYIGDVNGEKLLIYIARLAQSLGMSITAEGVETSKQLEFLKNLHCDDIQGYFFSKPLPLQEYEAFAKTHAK